MKQPTVPSQQTKLEIGPMSKCDPPAQNAVNPNFNIISDNGLDIVNMSAILLSTQLENN
jgi:hypothetical protein